MVCRDFILPEICKPCLFLSVFQFAKLIVPYLRRCFIVLYTGATGLFIFPSLIFETNLFPPMAEILLSLKNFENKKVDKFFSELVNLSWRRHPDLNWGMELLQSSALPLGYVAIWITGRENLPVIIFGAGDEARTRYLHLGKVALYQMSYTCISYPILCRGGRGDAWNFRDAPGGYPWYPPGTVVPPAGIEPATRGFSVPCSTN